jgi:APA family basic amino acid/polyamine antiporter
LLFIVEYAAWFIGWNFALLYQLAALTVVVGWSDYVVNLAKVVSNHNVTASIVQAPVIWNEDALRFSVTGQAINLPAIVITIAVTIFLVIETRIAAMVNLVLVVIKIIILLIFIFACCKYVDRKNYIPFFPPNLGKGLSDSKIEQINAFYCLF